MTEVSVFWTRLSAPLYPCPQHGYKHTRDPSRTRVVVGILHAQPVSHNVFRLASPRRSLDHGYGHKESCSEPRIKKNVSEHGYGNAKTCSQHGYRPSAFGRYPCWEHVFAFHVRVLDTFFRCKMHQALQLITLILCLLAICQYV